MIYHFAELEKNESEKKISLNYDYSGISKGTVIKPGQIIELFEANDSIGVKLANKYLNETIIKIDYCSIYDDCWRMLKDDISEL